MEENFLSVVNTMVGSQAAGSQVTVTCWFPSATTSRYMHLILLPRYGHWPDGWHTCLQIKLSRIELQGTLCCVLGQDTQLSQCLSPPRCINVYWQICCG